ncbi:MAG: hypothetical protein JW947_03805 [Sedimentisphaerales bacterium]|nr:hypothetical protein [Sedimentisphaerales bacterium]
MSLKEKLENNIVYVIIVIAISSFLAGVGAVKLFSELFHFNFVLEGTYTLNSTVSQNFVPKSEYDSLVNNCKKFQDETESFYAEKFGLLIQESNDISDWTSYWVWRNKCVGLLQQLSTELSSKFENLTPYEPFIHTRDGSYSISIPRGYDSDLKNAISFLEGVKLKFEK